MKRVGRRSAFTETCSLPGWRNSGDQHTPGPARVNMLLHRIETLNSAEPHNALDYHNSHSQYSFSTSTPQRSDPKCLVKRTLGRLEAHGHGALLQPRGDFSVLLEGRCSVSQGATVLPHCGEDLSGAAPLTGCLKLPPRQIVPEPSGCLKLLLFDVDTDFKVLSKSGAKDFGMYLGKTPTVLDAFDIAR